MKYISLSKTAIVDIALPDCSSALSIPYFDVGISAGFPSPADDFIASVIDLNKELIRNKDTTFLARVKGRSMINAGIFDGDLLIIDKSLAPHSNMIAVCQIDGEFLIKRIKIEREVIWLIAENEDYTPIKVTADNQFIIWGIVTASIKLFNSSK